MQPYSSEACRGTVGGQDKLSDVPESCRGFNAGVLNESREAVVVGALAGRIDLRGSPYTAHVRIVDNQEMSLHTSGPTANQLLSPPADLSLRSPFTPE